MTDRKRNNSIWKLLPTAAMMLVIAAVLTLATYAWQVTNHETNDQAGTVTSDDVDASIMPYSLFINEQTPVLDGEGDPTGEYTYEVVVFSDVDNVALNSYDAILGRNPYSSAYIRMPVYGASAGDTLTFTVSANGTLCAEKNNEPRETVGGHELNVILDQYISNIIRISCANIPTTTIAADADKDTIYHSAKEWFDENSAPNETFVTYNDRPSAKEPIVLTGKNSSVNFVLSDGNYTIEDDGMVYVYFKIDYEYDLVDAYISALRLEVGGFKIGEAGHADFSGEVENVGFDLDTIAMTISN